MSKLIIWYYLSKIKKTQNKRNKIKNRRISAETLNSSSWPQFRWWFSFFGLLMDCRYLFRTSNPTKARSPYMYIITTNYNKCHTIGQYSTAIGPGPTAQGRLCKVANLYWYAEHLALTISKKKKPTKTLSPWDCCECFVEESDGFFDSFTSTWFLLPMYWALLCSCFFGHGNRDWHTSALTQPVASQASSLHWIFAWSIDPAFLGVLSHWARVSLEWFLTLFSYQHAHSPWHRPLWLFPYSYHTTQKLDGNLCWFILKALR